MTSNLKEYLDYYKGTRSPGYAVLVVGDWGVGKTFQVKRCIPDQDRYYVSLFGLQSVAEVHASVLAEADPSLSKTKTFFSTIEERAAAGGHWATALGSAAAGLIGAALRKEIVLERTLIFDDLERSSIPINDILGVINTYIEQRGARVIVIAHDTKIQDSFISMKEKLFGQTIRVLPYTREAFDIFVKKISPKDQREFIIRFREEICGTFKYSRTESLRILRHVVEDIGRLYGALEPAHIENDGAMRELVSLFCAFNFEVRGDAIKPADMRGRRVAHVMHLMRERHALESEETNRTAIVESNEKYIGVDLKSTLLSDDALVEMLVDGIYRPETIRASLNSSHYFIEPAEAPPWKLVMSFDTLPDNVVNDALKKLDASKNPCASGGLMIH